MDENKNIIVPKWWDDYKKRNPDSTEEYDPRQHCCEYLYKDFCRCVQEMLKEARKRKNSRTKRHYAKTLNEKMFSKIVKDLNL